MWILTIVILFSSGAYETKMFPTSGEYDCLNKAEQIVHMTSTEYPDVRILATGCSRVLEG